VQDKSTRETELLTSTSRHIQDGGRPNCAQLGLLTFTALTSQLALKLNQWFKHFK